MQPIFYARYQFPAEIIRHATWLYFRFTLSYRDVEELLAERGIETSYETVRRWVLKFGPMFARNLRRLRPRPTSTWHLDEMVVSIQGRARFGSPAPDRQGRPPGSGRLVPYEAFLVQVVEAEPAITMPELAARLLAEHGVTAAPAVLSRLLCRLGFTYKKIPDGGGMRTRRPS
jgi:transposase